MIKRIISLLCLFTTFSLAQETLGPVSTDYRMKLWKNWSGSVIYEGSLQSPTSNIDIGKEYQYRVNRIAYQWNIDYSDIPQNSTIDKVKITYKYAYQDASSNLPLFIYELDKNLNDSEPDIGNLYLGMNGTSAAYGRKIGEWHDLPNQLVTFETTSYNINTWRTVIDNALQKGKLVIGFKSSVEDWENSPNRNYRIRSDSVTLQIEFTPPTRNVILNQKLSTGTSVGVLKHWEGSAWSSDIAPGTEKTLSIGSNEVFLGDQNIYSNQKYNNWNSNFNNVQNFKSIEIDEFTTSIQSNFEPTYSGITIENSIEGTSINNGNIQFKDPWFIDYPDQEFNGTLRNRGMNDAIFYLRSSPFHPDYNTSYEGITYKGAFLNQGYDGQQWDEPFYKVKAPQQTITINGNNHQIYFLNWSATNASLQNFTSAETGVAFHTDNAVVTARYKAIDLTNNVNALTNNNQAKLIRTGTSSNGTLFKVYESLDCVWLEKSTNQGSSWQLMNNGKPLNDIDNEWKGKSPSLDKS